MNRIFACYFFLILYCGATFCELWFVSGQTTVQMSVYCGTVFGLLWHPVWLLFVNFSIENRPFVGDNHHL